MSLHLVLVAAWVEALDSDSAADAVVAAMRGVVVPKSGAVVCYSGETAMDPEFYRELKRLNLQEALDFRFAGQEGSE